jgi:predicted permease
VSSKSRRKQRNAGPQRPSTFFLIALALGVILLGWIAWQLISRPMTPVKRSEVRAVTSARA